MGTTYDRQGITAKSPVLTPAIGVQALKLLTHSHASGAKKTIGDAPCVLDPLTKHAAICKASGALIQVAIPLVPEEADKK